jgi:TonB family protein
LKLDESRKNLVAKGITVGARLSPQIRRTPLRREFSLTTLALATAALVAVGQSTNIVPISGSTPVASASQPTDSAAAQITPPKVISQPSPDYSNEARKKKISGSCQVSFTVDTDGIPQSVYVIKSLEPSLDASAVTTVETWRFKPAMKDGKTPVPFDLTAEVGFQIFDVHKSEKVSAIIARPDSPGTLLSFDSSRVIPPVPTTIIAPKYPFWAKMGRISGDCTVGMILDSEGIPQNVHMVKSLDRRLDESAIKAVMQWRYKPALHDGVPVPIEMSVVVKFRLD